MVAQKPSPVFGKKVKRRLEFRLGVLAADAESAVDQLQQTGSLRKHGVSLVQPLGQVKLQTRESRSPSVETSGCTSSSTTSATPSNMLANLCKQHENDIGRVEVQRRHHVLVEEDKLIRRSVGGEERRDERTETPLLQDGLQDAAALLCITLNEHLCTTQAGATRD